MSRFGAVARAQFEYNDVPNPDGDADIVYLNLDIINNTTNDPVSAAQGDPQIRFNETRDAPIIKDASKYQFSIVRFVMNGANKDLPLFIPVVKTVGTPPPGVAAQDWTEYECAIGYQQTWATTNFPGGITFTIAPPVNSIIYVPETQNLRLAPLPRNPIGTSQDLTSRYYWVYTYQHWVDLTNAAFATAQQTTYNAFAAAWAASGTGDAFPYPTLASFQAAVGPPPRIEYSETTGLFSIYASALSFTNNNATNVPAFVPPGGPAPNPTTAPQCRLFFDSNMFGIYSNFSNIYYGGPTGLPYGVLPAAPNTVLQTAGYVNEILFPNKEWNNLTNPNPTGALPVVPNAWFWVATQDYESTSSLWSPVSSVVFTSALLPVRTEGAGEPIVFGDGNLGYSSAAIQNAFQPIVTDITLDLANDGSDAYRKMIWYAPNAEYRMSSMTPSRQPVNSIDIQVFWKNRLDGQLYPLTMFNLASVSIKIMFRRIRP